MCSVLGNFEQRNNLYLVTYFLIKGTCAHVYKAIKLAGSSQEENSRSVFFHLA